MEKLEFIKELMPLFNDINEAYSYLGISDIEFEQIVLSVVDRMKQKRYSAMIQEIKNYLEQKTKDDLKDNERAINIINNYIGICFANSNGEDELAVFKKLNFFFKKYEYIPPESVLTAVLEENKKFLELTTKLDRRYNKSLSKEEFNNVMKNPALMQALEN